MTQKTCFKCGKTKDIDQFHKHLGMKDGRLNKCGECTVNDVRLWREKKGKKQDRVERYARELELGTRTRIRSQAEISAAANPNKIPNYGRDHYKHHKAKIIERSRQWAKDNPEKTLIFKRKKHTKRYANDPVYRLTCCLRSRLRSALRGRKKTGSAIKLLGCTAHEAAHHIASQFQEGMSWDNWGEWEVDHIRPFASFDLTNPQHVAEVCHFTNLQPLWKPENRAKGSFYVMA